MEEMEKVTVNRLIEWLKEHGHTSDEIVECIEYITGDKKRTNEEYAQAYSFSLLFITSSSINRMTASMSTAI